MRWDPDYIFWGGMVLSTVFMGMPISAGIFRMPFSTGILGRCQNIHVDFMVFKNYFIKSTVIFWFMLSKCSKNHIYEIPLTVKRHFSMLSIVDIFGRAKVLGFFFGGGGSGGRCNMKMTGIFLGMPKFVG